MWRSLVARSRACFNTSAPRLAEQKLLFTPGPLLTTPTVKTRMLVDMGSRDTEFVAVIDDIRQRLISLANVDPKQYTAVLMQGSGTFAVESCVGTVVPKQSGELLVVVNGAYGERWVKLGKVLGIPTHEVTCGDNELPNAASVAKALMASQSVTHVLMCHCETTTGIINNVDEIGQVVHQHGRRFIVDSMSGFGAVPIDMQQSHVDFLISSSNKCIQGVPGFAFVIARIAELARAKGNARSLSLDLHGQWEALDRTHQFRFTPPTHTLLAFHQALLELEEEGGLLARQMRYQHNRQVIREGMRAIGFQEYMPTHDTYVITTYLFPKDPKWSFERFYARLSELGCVIYPGKLSKTDCFRIGNIGNLTTRDCQRLLDAVQITVQEMGINISQ